MFFINGSAPPSSRKLTPTPESPPRLVLARPPSYAIVRLYGRTNNTHAYEVRKQVHIGSVEGALVEDTVDLDVREGDAGDVGLLVVADERSVDQESQDGGLVLGSVVLEQACGGSVASFSTDQFRARTCGIVVADGHIGWALSQSCAGQGCNNERGTHGCLCV